MAFGAVLATSGNTSTAIPANFSPSAAVAVLVGNLIVVVISERIAGTTCTGVTDNLGNSYTPAGSVGSGSNSGVKLFYSVCTVAGSCTPVAACTSSSADAVISCAVYDGPFSASPLDQNPACLSDSATPFATNLSGTLSQPDELLIGYWGTVNSAVTYSSATPSPATIDRQGSTGSGANSYSGCLTSVVVSATTSVAMGVSGTTGTSQCGVATFKAAAVGPQTYNVSVTEPGTAADTPGALAIFPSSITEAAIASDSPSALVIFPSSVSEAATATDADSSTAVFPRSVSESATATDTDTSAAIFPSSATEAATATDAPSSLAVFPSSVSESASSADAPASTAVFPSSISESATATDAPTGGLLVTATVAESASATDSDSASLTISASASESTTATDGDSSSAVFASFVTETGAANDSGNALGTFGASVVETASATDSSDGVLANQTYSVDVTEAASATDDTNASTVSVPNEDGQTVLTDRHARGVGPAYSRKKWKKLQEEEAAERAAILAEQKRLRDEKTEAKRVADEARAAKLRARVRATELKVEAERLEIIAADARAREALAAAIALQEELEEDEEDILMLLAA